MSDKILSKVIRTAEGRSRDDKYWTTREWTFQEFADRYLVDFERGPKDARCITQGALVGQRRLGRAVDANYVGMYDHDTGETIDEIAEKIQVAKNPVTGKGKGYFAILWTTHSHLKNTTDISQSALAKYSKKTGIPLDEENFVELARGYLKAAKNVKQAVLDSITDVSEVMTAEGVKYRVTHAPMHRVRSLFLFDEPYDFTKGGLQQDRITEWKERYAGFATSLGLTTDPSCVDPSRLMYTPRIAVGADRSVHEIRVVNPDGNLLNWQDMPRLGKVRKSTPRGDSDNPFANAAQELTGRASVEEAEKFKTPGLKKFLALAKGCFEIERFLEEQGADFRGSNGVKHHFECPNDDAHTDAGNPDDKGFFVVNASDNDETGGFSAYCAHATCLSEFGNDRARYLDAACVKYGIAHARDLIQWCTESIEWDADEETKPEFSQEEIADADKAFREAVAALPDEPTTEEKQRVLRLIAEGPNGLLEDDRIDLLADKVGANAAKKRTFKGEIKKFRDAARAAPTVDGDNTIDSFTGPAHPVPPTAEHENTTICWDSWPFSDQMRVASARFVKGHKDRAKVFSRPEGGYVRLISRGDNVFFKPIANPNEWSFELGNVMEFRRAATETREEQEVAPFSQVVAHLSANTDLLLPMVERVVEVPVFAPDGTIRTEKGYCEGSKTYLNPKIEFYPVGEVTEGDVGEAVLWLIEATRDFPFSDDFSGSDPLPVRVKGDVDENGFPRANMLRGVSSRANFFGLVIQPFVRTMIDGPTPAYLIDKSMPGTGAGFLCNVASMILTGERATGQTIAADEDEFRKEIMATLREGASTIFWDNIKHRVDSATLAAALTSGKMKGRVLGCSETVTMEVKATWIFAAKKVLFSG